MKTKDSLQVCIIVSVLLLALVLNPLGYAAPQESASPSDRQSQNKETSPSPLPDGQSIPIPPAISPPAMEAAGGQLPDSPSAVRAQSVTPATPQPADAQEQQQTQAQPPSQDQPQERPHEPVGTAAAESVPTSGVAASRPAGAALAPAKQRRIRSILIKTGALIGVGVAIGTTMALSQASPSKPPGSH